MSKFTAWKLRFCLNFILTVGLLWACLIQAAEKGESSSPLSSVTIKREARSKSPGWSKSFDCGPGMPEVERLCLAPKDKVVIRFKFEKARGSVSARVSAEDGGVINGKKGSVFIPSLGTPEIEFAVGGHRGRYTLRVEQGDQLQIIEFWVGEEIPQGQAGPKLTFKGE